MTPSEEKPLLALFDGHGIIHRAYHAFKEPLIVRKTGEVVTAVYGLANTLLSVLEQLNPTHIAIALDPRGPTFRHDLDATYKAQRVAAPEDLTSQFERCIELIEAFNIPVFRVPGFEADDVLGTLAREADEQGIDTFVVSLDSDMVQLIGPHVRLFMMRPYQRDTVTYDEEAVRERYGFEPRQMADFKGLKGDVSDNIPGVPGIGEKTAVRLIQQFGSLEGVYEHIDEVEPEKLRELLRSSRGPGAPQQADGDRSHRRARHSRPPGGAPQALRPSEGAGHLPRVGVSQPHPAHSGVGRRCAGRSAAPHRSRRGRRRTTAQSSTRMT